MCTDYLQILANVLILYGALLVLGLQYLFYDPPTFSEVDEVFRKFILAIIETMLAALVTGQGVSGCFLLILHCF